MKMEPLKQYRSSQELSKKDVSKYLQEQSFYQKFPSSRNSLRSSNFVEMMTFFATLGIAITPSQAKEFERMRKGAISGEKILKTDPDKIGFYQSPKMVGDVEIPGEWYYKERDLSSLKSSSFRISPHQFPLSIKRIVVGLALRSSPLIAEYLSRKGFDVFALLSTDSKKDKSLKGSDGDNNIENSFKEILKKDFLHRDLVSKFANNLLTQLQKGTPIKDLKPDEQDELLKFINQFSRPTAEKSVLENSQDYKFQTRETSSQTTDILPLKTFIDQQRGLGNSSLISLEQSPFNGKKLIGQQKPKIINFAMIDGNSTAGKFIDHLGLRDSSDERVVFAIRDIDFSNVDLTCLNIDDLLFENCSFSGALMPFNITNSTFSNCDISYSRWAGNYIGIGLGIIDELPAIDKINSLDRGIKRFLSIRNQDPNYLKSLFPNGVSEEVKRELQDAIEPAYKELKIKSQVKAKAFSADFSGCSFNGFVAMNLDFKGANCSETQFTDISLTECSNLDLRSSIVTQHKSENSRDSLRIDGLTAIDFSGVESKYGELHGVEFTKKLKFSSPLANQIPTKLFNKIKDNEIIYIKVESPAQDLQLTQLITNSTQSVRYYPNNATKELYLAKITQYLKKLYDGTCFRIVGEEFTEKADSVLKLAFYGGTNSSVKNKEINDVGNLIYGEAVSFVNVDYLDRQDAEALNCFSVVDGEALSQKSAYFEHQSMLQAIKKLDLFQINCEEDLRKESTGVIPFYSIMSDDQYLIIRRNGNMLLFQNKVDQVEIAPMDRLAVEMATEAISGRRVEVGEKNDLFTNINKLNFESRVIFQESSNSLNRVNIDDYISFQSLEIYINKAKDQIKSCFMGVYNNCIPNALIKKNDVLIFIRMIDDRQKVILVSGGVKQISIQDEFYYKEELNIATSQVVATTSIAWSSVASTTQTHIETTATFDYKNQANYSSSLYALDLATTAQKDNQTLASNISSQALEVWSSSAKATTPRMSSSANNWGIESTSPFLYKDWGNLSNALSTTPKDRANISAEILAHFSSSPYFNQQDKENITKYLTTATIYSEPPKTTNQKDLTIIDLTLPDSSAKKTTSYQSQNNSNISTKVSESSESEFDKNKNYLYVLLIIPIGLLSGAGYYVFKIRDRGLENAQQQNGEGAGAGAGAHQAEVVFNAQQQRQNDLENGGQEAVRGEAVIGDDQMAELVLEDNTLVESDNETDDTQTRDQQAELVEQNQEQEVANPTNQPDGAQESHQAENDRSSQQGQVAGIEISIPQISASPLLDPQTQDSLLRTPKSQPLKPQEPSSEMARAEYTPPSEPPSATTSVTASNLRRSDSMGNVSRLGSPSPQSSPS